MVSSEPNLASWMKEEALPLWAERGVDRQKGGFVEELNQDGSPSSVAFKRVRVQGRQLFSFSIAAILGWNKDAARIADLGFEYLKTRCRGKDGVWVKKLSRDGAILDSQLDLYDTAFIVLGLITYYRLTKNSEALALVEDTLRMVQTHLAADSPAGYRQLIAEKDILRQNPNMHWFECMLFCYEATQDSRFLAEVSKFYKRMEDSVIDGKTGALREIFDNQWKPIREGGKILVEPGHHYEWAWLFNRASSKIAVNPDLITRIAGFADRYGVNAQTGLVYDQVSDQGELTQSTHRLWVQTEALKAWLVRPDVGEAARIQRIKQIESNLLKYYLTREPKGSWSDRLDSDGRCHPGPIPASSMYHIMVCVTEFAAWRTAQA
jgi:mannose-6-phosphate isomerase